eukprot:SAG11_NODE_3539_length_2381_cov_2.118755_1_plen_375_part_00
MPLAGGKSTVKLEGSPGALGVARCLLLLLLRLPSWLATARLLSTNDTATPPQFSQPMLDNSTGSYFVNVSAPAYQAGPNALEVLLPSRPGTTGGIVLALPPSVGDSTGSPSTAIQLVRAAGWHDRHNVAVVTPAFSLTPWFADRGGGGGGGGGGGSGGGSVPVRQEAYLLQVVLPYLQGGGLGSLGGVTLAGNVSLLGFSKSGWGAFSLIARNPTRFHRAALWDTPSMLSGEFCSWLTADLVDGEARPQRLGLAGHGKPHDLWDMLVVFGDCAVWKAHAPVELVRAGAASPLTGRLWLGGQHYFGNWPLDSQLPKGTVPVVPPGAPFNHTVQFHALLATHQVDHLYDDTLDPGGHEWSWLWMKPAMDSLLQPPP